MGVALDEEVVALEEGNEGLRGDVSGEGGDVLEMLGCVEHCWSHQLCHVYCPPTGNLHAIVCLCDENRSIVWW